MVSCKVVNFRFYITHSLQPSPPIITHTAATPQDSPSTTLEDIPEFRYNVTHVMDEPSAIRDTSLGLPSSSESFTQKTSVSFSQIATHFNYVLFPKSQQTKILLQLRFFTKHINLSSFMSNPFQIFYNFCLLYIVIYKPQ